MQKSDTEEEKDMKESLKADIEKFLEEGGEITYCEPGKTSDPKKAGQGGPASKGKRKVKTVSDMFKK